MSPYEFSHINGASESKLFQSVAERRVLLVCLRYKSLVCKLNEKNSGQCEQRYKYNPWLVTIQVRNSLVLVIYQLRLSYLS